MELSAFFLFALIASVTPGPSNVLLTTVGAQMGILRGIPALVGTALGTGLILFIVGFALGASVLENEAVLSTLRFVGIGAILWLAWVIATAPVSTDTTQPDSNLKFGFLPALLLQWVNPKAWIVSVSIVGAFMVSEGSAFLQAATLGPFFHHGCCCRLLSLAGKRCGDADNSRKTNFRSTVQSSAWSKPGYVDDHADMRRKDKNV